MSEGEKAMTQETKCENTGGVNFLGSSQSKLCFNSQESPSLQFTRHRAVGLSGKTKYTTSSTSSQTEKKSQHTGGVKPSV